MMNMYTRYDRNRLQRLRQHSFTYASFVRYMLNNKEILELLQLNLHDIYPTVNKPVSVVLGSHMSENLIKWSRLINQTYYSSITRVYYRDTNRKCFIHNRLRCNECNKQKIGFDEAVKNLYQILKRFVEWGSPEESSETEVIRLQGKVDKLSESLRKCRKGGGRKTKNRTPKRGN